MRLLGKDCFDRTDWGVLVLLQEERQMIIFVENQTVMRQLLAIALLGATLFAGVSCGANKENSVHCIWDHEYSAFPSIVRYQDALYVSFREGVSQDPYPALHRRQALGERGPALEGRL